MRPSYYQPLLSLPGPSHTYGVIIDKPNHGTQDYRSTDLETQPTTGIHECTLATVQSLTVGIAVDNLDVGRSPASVGPQDLPDFFFH